MRLTADQQIYPCEEHGTVPIPLADLVTNGRLDIYPGVTGRGYFDIDYSQGCLVLRASRYVGLIPLSDRIAIHVRPKAPVSNLMWLVWRSGGQFKQLEGIVRGYHSAPGEIEDPENLYVGVFAGALERMYQRGVLKQYETRELDNSWRGRLSMTRSVTRHYARGRRYTHTFATTDLTLNNDVNRIIKHTAQRLLPHLDRDRGSLGQKLASGIRRSLGLLSTADDSQITPSFVAMRAPALIRGLPSAYRDYESALWLSYLIATRSGVIMEQVGSAHFESVLINVSEIFEKYVRLLCLEASDLLGCNVYDGNKRPTPLFVDKPIPASPDIQLSLDGQTLGLLDAKYKDEPKREDRYELIAHCEATNARKAAFVCPTTSEQPRLSHYGTMRNGLKISLIRINLNCDDMRSEEVAFVESVRAFLRA